MDDYSWVHDLGAVDMNELSSLYRIAPLGSKPPEALAAVFGNSMFVCFVYAGDVLVGAGRFLRMNTAMAIWHDSAPAIESGLLSAKP